MTEFQQLSAAAYHAEKVASRRLALKESLSVEQALRQTLEQVAGSAGLQQLLANRSAQALADVERLADRRQIKRDQRALKLSKNQIPVDAWQAWFDGSARPNPGRCWVGGVLKGPHGEHVEVCQDAGYGNSSEAEYFALIALLEKAVQIQASPLIIYGDSQVVIEDVMRPTNAALTQIESLAVSRTRVLVLMAQLSNVRLCWIPRHKNSEADALSQRASS
jgi:ribonuclease HI